MPARVPAPPLRHYLSVSEAAAVLGVCAATLRRWDRAGKLVAGRHPLNGYRLYRRAELEAVLDRVAGKKQELMG